MQSQLPFPLSFNIIKLGATLARGEQPGEVIMENKTILIIDNDQNLTDLLRGALEASGYAVLTALDGAEGRRVFDTQTVHLVILDIMLMKRDGWTLSRDLRAISDVPIVMLTARQGVEDIVRGLELGADDYIVKPFNLREVVARVKAVLARISGQAEGLSMTRVKTIGEISVDLDHTTVLVRSSPVALTPIERELLLYLMTNPGKMIDRETLLHDVWGAEQTDKTNVVDVTVRRLREKIEADPSSPIYLQTVRGKGYRFVDPHVRQA